MSVSSEATPITGSFSVFLDLLRIYAALCVFVCHAEFGWFGEIAIPGFLEGHDAVVVFFVLSGFVIAYSQNQNRREFTDFVIARLTRLYVTMLPAMFLTVACTIVVAYINPTFTESLLKPFESLRYVVCLLFVQEVWFRNLTPGFNGPLWSLSYELFYYILFAAATLIRVRWLRYTSVLLIAVIAGPNILLLLPAWLIGVVVLRLEPRRPKSIVSQWLLLLAGIVIGGVLVNGGWGYPHHEGRPPLNYSSAFFSDWILALSVGMILYAMRGLLRTDASPGALRMARRLGDLTFPVYIFHFPLLAFFAAISGADRFDHGRTNLLGIGLAFVASVGLSLISEQLRPGFASMIKLRFAWLHKTVRPNNRPEVAATVQ
ncbi:acyltransferase family protein [Novipirellula sp.]|uniref:acyltransferase family protein n=1 Tax=Novipirellula sp. TaxID=2795430 RepID=UPI003561B223